MRKAATAACAYPTGRARAFSITESQRARPPRTMHASSWSRPNGSPSSADRGPPAASPSDPYVAAGSTNASGVDEFPDQRLLGGLLKAATNLTNGCILISKFYIDRPPSTWTALRFDAEGGWLPSNSRLPSRALTYLQPVAQARGAYDAQPTFRAR